jgi:hypothetical protein
LFAVTYCPDPASLATSTVISTSTQNLTAFQSGVQ